MTIAVEDRVARVQVEERFRNSGPTMAEGSYFYPLAGEASFTDFSLWLNDEELRGEPMDADKAREIYESIVRRRKDPALLTLAGHGLVRAQVFPIQPGETRKVALRYTQLLARQGDALRLRYALGLRGSDSGTELHIEIARGDLYGTPYSPTHTIDSRTQGGRLDITVSPGERGRRGAVPSAPPASGRRYRSQPCGRRRRRVLHAVARARSGRPHQALPRDLTLVVDVSGSMSGTKLEQAKAALQQALGTLGRERPVPGDRLLRRGPLLPARVRSPRPATIWPTRASSWTAWRRRAAPISPERSTAALDDPG